MTMSIIARRISLLANVGVFLIAIGLSGCPSAAEKPEAAPAAKSRTLQPARTDGDAATGFPAPGSAVSEEIKEKRRDFGPPLVDKPDSLKRLDPDEPVWFDPTNKHVVLQGEVCRAGYPLEFFATYSNRSYEAVVSVNVTPSIVHAGLLLAGAVAGHPARFQPEFVAPTGTEVAIEIRWKDDKGKVQSAPAQEWIRNIKTRKALDTNWVFAGSQFLTDPNTQKEYYTADSGELICVLSLPNAMLDLPILSYGALEARQFEAFEEHLPPPGTPITLLLKPILSAGPGASQTPAGKDAGSAAVKRAEVEKLAIEAAEPWLALIDQGQYARSWETAAEQLKDNVERRDFVKKLSGSRKLFGDVISRTLESKQYLTSVPGAPDGQYVLLQYKTSFTNKKLATETITPMLEKDKKWRVSGYYIK